MLFPGNKAFFQGKTEEEAFAEGDEIATPGWVDNLAAPCPVFLEEIPQKA